MTDIDKAELIHEILTKLESTGPDFTTGQLAKLISMNPGEVSRLAEKFHGHYKVGCRSKFRRAEILYRRAMGLNLYRE